MRCCCNAGLVFRDFSPEIKARVGTEVPIHRNEPSLEVYNQTQADELVDLMAPVGFFYNVRVYYPTINPNEDSPLFYDAEVFGFLQLVNEDTDSIQEAINVAVYANGDYWDRDGNILNHVTGSSVTNLIPGSFTYYESDITTGGQMETCFGYELNNFDLSFPVNTPDNWNDLYPNQYVHIDVELGHGGVSAAVPEPASILTIIFGISILYSGISRRKK